MTVRAVGALGVDIRQLRYFIAIVEEGSLTAASGRLGVAQPSLSLHLTKLEQELGVTLVHRSPRGVALTPSGEILLTHAREICKSMQICQDSVRHSVSHPEGAVAFGVPSSVSMVLSVPLAETVRLELPRVRLRTVEAMSGFIQNWLLDETLDIGFLYDIGENRSFEARELMREDLHFFAPADGWPLPYAPGTPVPLADIASLELVLPSQDHNLRRLIDRYASSANIELKVDIEMDALAQIKELVVRGSGYTILAPAAAQDRVDRGELVSSPIVEPSMTRPVFLVRKLTKPQTYVCREVERLALEVVEDLVRRKFWKVRSSTFEDAAAATPLGPAAQ